MAPSYDYTYFKTPCSIIVAGPSQCGKTTFTRHLLRSTSRAFDRPVRRIVYCYGSRTPNVVWRTRVFQKTFAPCSPIHWDQAFSCWTIWSVIAGRINTSWICSPKDRMTMTWRASTSRKICFRLRTEDWRRDRNPNGYHHLQGEQSTSQSHSRIHASNVTIRIKTNTHDPPWSRSFAERTSSRLDRNAQFLRLLSSSKPSVKKKLAQQATKDQVDTLSELA